MTALHGSVPAPCLALTLLVLLYAEPFGATSVPSCGFSDEGVCRGVGNGAKSLAKLTGVETAALCCQHCANRTTCAAWTHYEHDGRPECNLLSGAGKRSTGNCSSALIAPAPGPAPRPPPPGAKNVLYLIVDDLRTQLGAYGHAAASTPNMDALAASGARFTHAYVQQAVCAPSRGSFMTGLRPDTLRLWTFKGSFRTSHPEWVSLPGHFKASGYAPVLGGGKTFHPGRPANYDEPRSWTQELPYFDFFEPGCPFNGTLEPGSNAYTHSVCPSDDPLDTFFDHQLANHTIRALRLASEQQRRHRAGGSGSGTSSNSSGRERGGASDASAADDTSEDGARPFFIAAGFRRPHLPWRMPRYYWDMFDGGEDTTNARGAARGGENGRIVLPPAHPAAPDGMPAVAWTCGDRCSWELANRSVYNFTLQRPVDSALAVLLRRAYMASMAFMDAEVGRVLAELDNLGMRNDTLVVLHGDHGWGLGEGNFWHKFSNMEHSARVPLLVRAPWLGDVASSRVVPSLVELVSLYPTMAALAGTPPPVFDNGTALPLDGADFSDLLAQTPQLPSPHRQYQYQYAFSQFPRCDGGDPTMASFNYCKSSDSSAIDYMGYSVRDARFRYTAWLRWDGAALRGRWGDAGAVEGEELYDHESDDGSSFDRFPVGWRNLANDTGFAADKQRLAGVLRAFFDQS